MAKTCARSLLAAGDLTGACRLSPALMRPKRGSRGYYAGSPNIVSCRATTSAKSAMELKAFLSHRYKSPEVNLYFHEIFAESAQIQFEVDIGSLPTNVTRLERMIRDADAFIGIYPFPGDPTKIANNAELQNASKYFRLEVELAIRSGKPSLVFVDKRYAPYFEFPQSFRTDRFDIQEVARKGGSPSKPRFRRLFLEFCEEVSSTMKAAASKPRPFCEMHVGIIVPMHQSGTGSYEQEHITAITETLHNRGVAAIKQFPWPPILHQEYLAGTEKLDWIIIDIGQSVMRSGIVGYLHGRFIPMVRLIKTAG